MAISKISLARSILLTLAATLIGLPVRAFALPDMTPAGTNIDNVAHVELLDGDARTSLTSNNASFQVQEIVDVRVDVLTPELAVEPDQSDQLLGFLITNLGNGFEAFDLSISAVDQGFVPQDCQVFVDWDGDALLDRTRDRLSSITPVLAPRASVKVWVSCKIPASAAHGALGRILLRAFPTVLRDGVTEGLMATAGNGGVYIVMGPNLRAASEAPESMDQPAVYKVGKVNAQLIKSQTVLDVIGGSRARPGSVVTYSLEAIIGPGLPARGVKITDPIPEGSRYVEGSLTLDGAALSDAADDDEGRFTGEGIEVGLGDIPPETRHLVTFKVRISPFGS